MDLKKLSPRQSHKLNVFARRMGRGINRFDMVQDGDRVLIGASGGKDSLAMSLALAERRRWVPIHYELFALFIEWREYPLNPADREIMESFFASLDIPLRIDTSSIYPPNLSKPFNCYICSANRKRLLFREAERLGVGKIALGHHQDDMVETTLLNLFFRGEFATMMPVQDFFAGRFQIIRPLCEVRESEVNSVSRALKLPVIPAACPRKELNQRGIMKSILKELARVNRRVRENVYRAAWNINYDYLPGHRFRKSGPLEPVPDLNYSNGYAGGGPERHPRQSGGARGGPESPGEGENRSGALSGGPGGLQRRPGMVPR